MVTARPAKGGGGGGKASTSSGGEKASLAATNQAGPRESIIGATFDSLDNGEAVPSVMLLAQRRDHNVDTYLNATSAATAAQPSVAKFAKLRYGNNSELIFKINCQVNCITIRVIRKFC